MKLNFGQRLTFRIGDFMCLFKLACCFVIIMVLIGGIWGTIWFTWINNDIWISLENGKLMRDIVCSYMAISYGAIVMLVITLVIIYIYGYFFAVHFLLIIITALALIAQLVLWIYSICLNAPNKQTQYLTSFSQMINSTSPPSYFQDWMDSNGCSQNRDCSDKIEEYVDQRSKTAFIVTLVLVCVYGAIIIILIIDLILMACIKPIDRNEEEEFNDQSEPSSSQSQS